MKRGKKYRAIEANLDKSKVYEIDEAIALAQKHSYARFDETVEVAIKLKVRKSDSIRDTLVLPNQFAAEKRIVVFARGDKAGEAKDAGAYMVGAEELVEKIKGGWLDFDVCVATPDMMKDVGEAGACSRSAWHDAQSQNAYSNYGCRRCCGGVQAGACGVSC